jgi:4,5-DOPA dioxygenase extradiol
MTTTRMPALFIGHGSPMNALADNARTQAWVALAATLPKPRAILMVSAHWTTRGTAITGDASPKTMHDFGGFPQALFDMRYPAAGAPEIAQAIAAHLAPLPVRLDDSWGFDHGSWSVLVKMFPQADVPLLQLSIDATQPAAFHFALGQKLSALRDQGILLMGSGNVVHNLSRMVFNDAPAHDWAVRFNARVRDALLGPTPEELINFSEWGADAALAAPTDEHFLPLLYVIGSRRDDEPLAIFNDVVELGAISMLSVVVGAIPST